MTEKPGTRIELSVGQRTGVLLFFGILPILGAFASISLVHEVLSSRWDPGRSVENWLTVGHAALFVLCMAFFWRLFVLLIGSAIDGVVHEELIARYGTKQIKKWFPSATD